MVRETTGKSPPACALGGVAHSEESQPKSKRSQNRREVERSSCSRRSVITASDANRLKSARCSHFTTMEVHHEDRKTYI